MSKEVTVIECGGQGVGVTGNTPGQRLRGKAASLVLAGMWGTDRMGGCGQRERGRCQQGLIADGGVKELGWSSTLLWAGEMEEEAEKEEEEGG